MSALVTGLTGLAATGIDELRLDFSDAAQLGIKVVVALFLFGIALDTRLDDVKEVVRRPGVIGAGLLAQFMVVPAATVLLALALDVRGSVAIGMVLVVCCPAGNVSNILTHRARGDVALSISLTTMSTVVSVVVTPVALAFWCGFVPRADALLRDVELDPWGMVVEAVLLIGLPFAAGLAVASRWPAASGVARRVLEPATLTLLTIIIVGGLASQLGTFLDYVAVVAVAIVLQNALSLGVGYGVGRGLRLPDAGARAMTFELGLRNTGLALVLALEFFPTLGGVAFVAALWGLWDVTTGFVLASYWRRETSLGLP